MNGQAALFGHMAHASRAYAFLETVTPGTVATVAVDSGSACTAAAFSAAGAQRLHPMYTHACWVRIHPRVLRLSQLVLYEFALRYNYLSSVFVQMPEHFLKDDAVCSVSQQRFA